MNRLLTVGLIVGCVASLPPAPPGLLLIPQANVIHLVTNLEQGEAYKTFGSYLASSGYAISFSDENFGVINTAPKKFDVTFLEMAQISIQVVIQSDSIIVVRGTVHSGGIEFKSRNLGQKSSALLKSWEVLEALCKNYPQSSSILFARE